jgi:glycerol-3-phosphate dehydrogenase
MAFLSCDLLVVGAGINGAGIARDAAQRGLSVVVCDRGDIAGATSSASTKLIHGGIRYLEQAAFGLVHESLRERDVLGRIAAHLVRSQRFIVPHTGVRPAWMLAAGLKLYDLLAGPGTLPRSQRLPAGFPLLHELGSPVFGAHAYHDLTVDDARLVLANLADARALGAGVLTRHALVAVDAHADGGWACELSGPGGQCTIRARCVVNAAGPWVQEIELLRGIGVPPIRLVQGSHIVIQRLHGGDDAWLLQQPDRRVVFVIPYGEHFHLVGTTETELHTPSDLGATEIEQMYLLEAVNRAFARACGSKDIRWTFSGMRPLIGGKGSARTTSREYRLSFDVADAQRAWLTVQGGKLTTYRRLAQRAVDRMVKFFGVSATCMTADRLLPGAWHDEAVERAALAQHIQGRLPSAWITALWARHGTLTGRVIEQALAGAGQGIDFGGGLYEAEARWCAEQEWADEAEDVMWRRTKCGLLMTPDQRAAFRHWWGGQRVI